MIETPSPNHGARPDPARIDLIVLHYTGMRTTRAALKRLCDPVAKVSAHYLIEESGAIHRMVNESRRAWHAGVASWEGNADINDRSIGIELANPGHQFGYRPFPEAQMVALDELLADILARRSIPPERVVGHSDVAPLRRQDPGELFDWQRLARRGLAFWPSSAGEAPTPDPHTARSLLTRCGYGHDDEQASFIASLAAFQRHFRPARCDGVLDPETMGLLAAVADQPR